MGPLVVGTGIIVDMYLFLYLTFFSINTISVPTKSRVKIDITQEGVMKEEINMEGLIRDYSDKFTNK